MYNKAAILRAAWADFRKMPDWWQKGDLRIRKFTECLKRAWEKAKYSVQVRLDAIMNRKPEKVLNAAEMERNIRLERAMDETKYLPLHMSMDREETRIRGLIAQVWAI